MIATPLTRGASRSRHCVDLSAPLFGHHAVGAELASVRVQGTGSGSLRIILVRWRSGAANRSSFKTLALGVRGITLRMRS